MWAREEEKTQQACETGVCVERTTRRSSAVQVRERVRVAGYGSGVMQRGGPASHVP